MHTEGPTATKSRGASAFESEGSWTLEQQLISLGELVGAIIVAPNGLGRIQEVKMAFCGGQPLLYLQIYLLEFSTFRFR